MVIDKKVLDRLLGNDPTLTYLDLSYQKLIAADIYELVKALEKNTYVTTLDVSGNPIGDAGMQLLAVPHFAFTTLKMSECGISSVGDLAKNNRLTELILASNYISTASVGILAESKTLQSLSLAGNNINDEGAMLIAKNNSLSSLILSHNKIDIKGAQSLAKQSNLTTLDLSYNQIQTEGAIALAENTHLKSLSIAGNHISTSGIAVFANNTMLVELDVSYNEVNNQAAIALAKNSVLTKLNLAYNQISFEGAHALAANTHLKSLAIRHNLLGDSGAIVLGQNKNITHLDLTGNRVGFEGAYALAMNNTLTSLVLSSNVLGDVGGVVLSRNNTLTELLLSYNGIKDAGAIALADNTTLKTLNLNYNMIGDKGKKALAESKTLTSLMLSPEQPPEFTDENLNTIFSLSESFLCISDIKGTIQFFNPSFSRALGYSDDEVLSNSFFNFLHPLDKPELEKRLREEKETPIQSYEDRFRCKDGSYIIVRWTSNIKHQRYYAVGTDVTVQRRVEKEYMLSKEETILSRLHEAEAYSLRQTEFISQLSHEIRNPLSSIYGLMEILKEQVKQVEVLIIELRGATTPLLQDKLSHTFVVIEESFNQMIVCAEYQKAILNDNLDIVRISEKKFTLEMLPFELKKSLMQTIKMFQAKATQKGVSLNFVAPENKEIWVRGDASRLKQIMVNLIGNALKFTDKGHIEITLSLPTIIGDRANVKIDVIDTGIGLDEEEIGHLFQRFSQAGLSTGSQYGGSGLGLYIAKQLAHIMQGDITVKSIKGKGSVFSVAVTLFDISAKEIKGFQEAVKRSPSIDVLQKPCVKKKILIVDDNVINQKILMSFLQKIGHECKVANDGLEALSAFDKFTFDIILMDIIMPKMDGITATKEIRKRETEKKLSKTFIFAITANALERDQKEGFEAGIDQYITKPFNKDEIRQKLIDLDNPKIQLVEKLPTFSL